jgi:ATP-dependent Clp protease ATP-binding subunit ClpX
VRSRHDRDAHDAFSKVLPEDLINYGLIPEFIGRLPVISAVHQLSEPDLIEILVEPKNALVKQYKRFFSFDKVELVFAEDSLAAIAGRALERETGARGLRSIIEAALMNVMFELPSRDDVRKCVVTRETIEKNLPPTLVTEATAPMESDEEDAAESA